MNRIEALRHLVQQINSADLQGLVDLYEALIGFDPVAVGVPVVSSVLREYLLDQSLVTLENELPALFVRIHRNCLVARRAIRGVERSGESWQILLHGHAERLPVSRRLWPAVRQALGL